MTLNSNVACYTSSIFLLQVEDRTSSLDCHPNEYSPHIHLLKFASHENRSLKSHISQLPSMLNPVLNLQCDCLHVSEDYNFKKNKTETPYMHPCHNKNDEDLTHPKELSCEIIQPECRTQQNRFKGSTAHPMTEWGFGKTPQYHTTCERRDEVTCVKEKVCTITHPEEHNRQSNSKHHRENQMTEQETCHSLLDTSEMSGLQFSREEDDTPVKEPACVIMQPEGNDSVNQRDPSSEHQQANSLQYPIKCSEENDP